VTLFVKNASYWAERLLASGVPYLKFYSELVFYEHAVISELHTNSHIVLFFEVLIYELADHAWLTNTCVPNDDDFEHRVMLMIVVLTAFCQLAIVICTELHFARDINDFGEKMGIHNLLII